MSNQTKRLVVSGLCFLLGVLIAISCAGCDSVPIRTDGTAPELGGAAADLVSSALVPARKMESEGTAPHSEEATFVVGALGALEHLTGPGEVLPPTDETVRELKLKLQAQKQGRVDDAAAAAEALRAAHAKIKELQAEGGGLAWLVLGISSLVALVGVAVLWLKTSWKVGALGLGGWALTYTAISLGMFYEQHETAVIAGLVIVVLAALGIVWLSKLLRREAAEWQENAATAEAVAGSVIDGVEAAGHKGTKDATSIRAAAAGVRADLDAVLADKGYLAKTEGSPCS